MGEYLKANRLIHELSTPEAHYQNFVERYVQTINKFTCALLHGQDVLRSKHWHWALFHAIDCRNRVPNTKTRPASPYELITGIKTNLSKTFQFCFGDIVAVHLPTDKRNWKFDMRWDVGVYVGQPEHSVEASLVYFPYKNQLLVRTDIAKLDMTADDYRRFYFKRYDMTENPSSTATRLTNRLDEWLIDFDQPPTEETNDEAPIELPTASLADPDEVPDALQIDPARRTRRTWDHLPPSRVTRAMGRRLENELEPRQRQHLMHAFTVAVKAFAARSSVLT